MNLSAALICFVISENIIVSIKFETSGYKLISLPSASRFKHHLQPDLLYFIYFLLETKIVSRERSESKSLKI